MSDIAFHPARRNQLLAQLPSHEWERLLPYLEPVDMQRDAVLYNCAHSCDVYFPTSATVSLLYLTEDGATPEIAVVGNDGLVANTEFFGNYASTSMAKVQIAGSGYRLSASVLKGELDHSLVLLRVLMNYSQDLFRQMAQTIVSKSHQAVEDQLSRRLLLSLDRLSSNTILMTQEILASTLNVRRESITKAAGRLQLQGLIKLSRGQITVTNRAGLEQRAGECYATA